jgi:thioesterase domain-containing protein
MTVDKKLLLQTRLHEQIPVSEYMQISVEDYDGGQLTLSAPLAPNTNHKSTAFGGSLYSLAVLAGWGLLFLKLEEAGMDGHIVIHESSIRYQQPVRGHMLARCRLPEEEQWSRFIRLYQKKGASRIRLQSEILCQQQRAVSFEGSYVVHN